MPEAPTRLPWARLPGHHKGDGGYVLSRQPDFIILGGSEGYAQPWFVGDLEIYEDPEFQAGYVLRETLIPGRDTTRPLRFRYYERTAPRTVPRPVPPAITAARFDAPDARGV